MRLLLASLYVAAAGLSEALRADHAATSSKWPWKAEAKTLAKTLEPSDSAGGEEAGDERKTLEPSAAGGAGEQESKVPKQAVNTPPPTCKWSGKIFNVYRRCQPEALCHKGPPLGTTCRPRNCALGDGRSVDLLTSDLGAFAWNSLKVVATMCVNIWCGAERSVVGLLGT